MEDIDKAMYKALDDSMTFVKQNNNPWIPCRRQPGRISAGCWHPGSKIAVTGKV